MEDFFDWLWDHESFMARAHCVMSPDGFPFFTRVMLEYGQIIIALSYFWIPLILLFGIKYTKKKFSATPLLIGSAFVASCGLTHLNDGFAFSEPRYNLQAVLVLICLIASVFAAVYFSFLLYSNRALMVIKTDVEEDERKRKKTADYLSLMLRSYAFLPGVFALLDTDLRYVGWSKRWPGYFGAEGRVKVDAHHYDVFPDIKKTHPEYVELNQKALSGQVQVGKSNYRGKCFEYRVSPVFCRDDVIGVIIDISDIKEAESSGR